MRVKCGHKTQIVTEGKGQPWQGPPLAPRPAVVSWGTMRRTIGEGESLSPLKGRNCAPLHICIFARYLSYFATFEGSVFTFGRYSPFHLMRKCIFSDFFFNFAKNFVEFRVFGLFRIVQLFFPLRSFKIKLAVLFSDELSPRLFLLLYTMFRLLGRIQLRQHDIPEIQRRLPANRSLGCRQNG